MKDALYSWAPCTDFEYTRTHTHTHTQTRTHTHTHTTDLHCEFIQLVSEQDPLLRTLAVVRAQIPGRPLALRTTTTHVWPNSRSLSLSLSLSLPLSLSLSLSKVQKLGLEDHSEMLQSQVNQESPSQDACVCARACLSTCLSFCPFV